MAGSENVLKKFVSKKPNAICWRPSSIEYGRYSDFTTGSWDDNENVLSVWRVDKEAGEPILLADHPHLGDVTDIKYISPDVFAVGSSTGGVRLVRHNDESGGLGEVNSWPSCHGMQGRPASCTALATSTDHILSVGEDGRLVYLSPNHKQPSRTIDEGDSSSSIYSVAFIQQSEALTGSMCGHLKLWDLRAKQAAKATITSPDQVGVMSLARHPHQPQVVAAGCEDGLVALWDLRAQSRPLALIQAHNAAVSDVEFNECAPDHLFTCGCDGQLIHWDASVAAAKALTDTAGQRLSGRHALSQTRGGSVNVWLTAEVAEGGVDMSALVPPSPFPCNSLSVGGSTVIAASDNEAIFVVTNVIAF